MRSLALSAPSVSLLKKWCSSNVNAVYRLIVIAFINVHWAVDTIYFYHHNYPFHLFGYTMLSHAEIVFNMSFDHRTFLITSRTSIKHIACVCVFCTQLVFFYIDTPLICWGNCGSEEMLHFDFDCVRKKGFKLPNNNVYSLCLEDCKSSSEYVVAGIDSAYFIM